MHRPKYSQQETPHYNKPTGSSTVDISYVATNTSLTQPMLEYGRIIDEISFPSLIWIWICLDGVKQPLQVTKNDTPKQRYFGGTSTSFLSLTIRRQISIWSVFCFGIEVRQRFVHTIQYMDDWAAQQWFSSCVSCPTMSDNVLPTKYKRSMQYCQPW